MAEINKLQNVKKDPKIAAEDQKQIVFESFKVSYKMNFIPSEAAHLLFIDSQLPIDSLLIQSMQNVDFIEVKNNTCKITKINDKLTNNGTLATLKV